MWFCAAIGLLFLAITLGVRFSPSFHRYIRNQSQGVQRSSERNRVDKHKIFKDEFESIRWNCLDAVLAARPDMVWRQWQDQRWQSAIVEDGIAVAVVPGMFSPSNRAIEHDHELRVLAEGDFAIECCVVAFWYVDSWRPTPLLVPGNEDEAIRQLQSLPGQMTSANYIESNRG